MQQIVDYFSHIPSTHRFFILMGGILLFWIIEGIIPLTILQYAKWRHAGINIFFTLTTIIINFAFAGMIIKASDWSVENKSGLLNMIEMPLWLYFLVGFCLLDLIGAYFIHWLEHRIKWMWRFHLVHHSDQCLDTTSANRHHPGESIFRAVFTLVGVWVLGTPIWLVMLYQSFSALLSQFNHANIALPKKLDIILSWVIVSPNMHKVHHHYMLPLTDTNFGNIFSIWDRIFGTFAYVEKPENIIYGIDTHMEARESDTLKGLLIMPFGEYRAPTGAKFRDDYQR
jgi:sterol desaturase/sphingolipid hydroxylase (fatty acid hydroxylase superfamily)